MRLHMLGTVAATLAVAAAPVGLASLGAEETPAQKVSVEGTFVRVAHNDQGWVTLGFRTANESVGQEWMLLEVGVTVQKGVKDYTLKRSDIALVAPGPKVVDLATQEDYIKADNLRALNDRADIARDPINYFPATASQPCALNFFADPASGQGANLARDQVDLSTRRGCVGRLYFHVPGGIQLGLYNLDVQFAGSTVRVPFQVMTKDEVKEFEKELKEARKKEKEEKNK